MSRAADVPVVQIEELAQKLQVPGAPIHAVAPEHEVRPFCEAELSRLLLARKHLVDDDNAKLFFFV